MSYATSKTFLKDGANNKDVEKETKMHYHITVVSQTCNIPPVVTTDQYEAKASFARAVDGFALITGAELKEISETEALFKDGSKVRLFACGGFCIA